MKTGNEITLTVTCIRESLPKRRRMVNNISMAQVRDSNLSYELLSFYFQHATDIRQQVIAKFTDILKIPEKTEDTNSYHKLLLPARNYK